ncbi:Sh3 and multiple ankyrin repeat domains protein 3 [Plakobranchus ocellatus]|uniref:Sh3 and multiple ankyrin repeat domains protein 3 n=1 Tax=Plakobranchus ocellatus TaxID=259542 RepID=A0AAV4C6P6_9GAST|nr:Sh3 and multiple ankyrin repeat domains protein 3 [Plakobranchus ocellatus]
MWFPQKCLQFQLEQTVWQAKSRVLTAFAKDLRDPLNYGLYLLPSNGRAGKFLEEERLLSEYPIQGPIGFLEGIGGAVASESNLRSAWTLLAQFKYKKRVYKMLHLNERKVKQLHAKSKLKLFLELVRAGNSDKINKMALKGLDPNFHDQDNGGKKGKEEVWVENRTRVALTC